MLVARSWIGEREMGERVNGRIKEFTRFSPHFICCALTPTFFHNNATHDSISIISDKAARDNVLPSRHWQIVAKIAASAQRCLGIHFLYLYELINKSYYHELKTEKYFLRIKEGRRPSYSVLAQGGGRMFLKCKNDVSFCRPCTLHNGHWSIWLYVQ